LNGAPGEEKKFPGKEIVFEIEASEARLVAWRRFRARLRIIGMGSGYREVTSFGAVLFAG
jgi:hypothetical protein